MLWTDRWTESSKQASDQVIDRSHTLYNSQNYTQSHYMCSDRLIDQSIHPNTYNAICRECQRCIMAETRLSGHIYCKQ